MAIHDRARKGRRREIELRAALTRSGASVAGIPVLEVGRRIEAYARNPLADALRRSFWKSKGDRVWRDICRRSLRERYTASWAWVVKRLGGA
jgi:hypothetical protein